MRKKVYLGDGVYAHQTDDGVLALTTENGVSISNTIYLEPEVIAALLRVLHAWKASPNASE